MAQPALRTRIDARLVELLGEMPPLPSDAAACLARVLDREPEKWTKLACCLAVLMNRDAVLACSSGPTLKATIGFSGNSQILAVLRRTDVPRLQNLASLPILAPEALDVVALKARRLLLGLFPRPYLGWIALTVPRGSLPMPDVLPASDVADRRALIRLIEMALDLTSDKEAADAHSKVA
ncbi:MAG: hypothetical protein ACRC14_08170 [Paracoccaceae bacterium]